ncbi:MAG: HDIG domain-containing protein [Spirochaetes bacterium]|nr:HDIG domain-containing protein [Spirochaetota bacterium]
MQYTYPDTAETYELMDKMEMMQSIREHSALVRDVCRIIYRNLKNSDNLDIELIETSALLHDITKSRAIRTGESHADTGAELLLEMGYPAVAEIILSHVHLNSVDINLPLTASEIVHYADKRVKHSTVVTIRERIDDLIERYGRTEDIRIQIKSRISGLEALENKIRSNLIRDIEPDLFRLNEK